MFGYVKAYKPEMKIKHYEEYRAVYCSVCRALGKRYGLIARLTLSYDFTFLAMMRICSESEKPCFDQKRCPFNPTKKCNFCNNTDSAFNFTADTAMLMVYYKIEDNLKDEGFFKRLLMRMIKPIFRRYCKKAKRYQPEIDKIISDMMKNQQAVENENTDSLDKAAQPTACAMGEILSYGYGGSKERILKRIGYCLGRWVYSADAFFDRSSDKKKGSYNPFNINNMSDEQIISSMNLTAGEMLNAYELLEVNYFDEVIRNIICDGLYNSIKNAGGKNNEKSL